MIRRIPSEEVEVKGEAMIAPWDFLLGCWHNKLSFPITVRRKNGAGAHRLGERAETYVVCLECGKRFFYSWEEMKILRRPKKQTAETHTHFGWFSRHRWSSRGT